MFAEAAVNRVLEVPAWIMLLAMTSGIVGYLLFVSIRRRWWLKDPFRPAYVTDGDHPTPVGFFIVGVSFSAFCSATYFAASFFKFWWLSDDARKSAAIPMPPMDIAVLGVAGLAWASLWAILDLVFPEERNKPLPHCDNTTQPPPENQPAGGSGSSAPRI
jgi:hypothetical protein